MEIRLVDADKLLKDLKPKNMSAAKWKESRAYKIINTAVVVFYVDDVEPVIEVGDIEAKEL